MILPDHVLKLSERDNWPKACDECGRYFYPITNGSRRTSFCLQCAAKYWDNSTPYVKDNWTKVAGESPAKWIETYGCDLVAAVWYHPEEPEESAKVELNREFEKILADQPLPPVPEPRLLFPFPKEREFLDDIFGKWTEPWRFERPLVGYDESRYDDRRHVYLAHNSATPRPRYSMIEREPWRELLAWSL